MSINDSERVAMIADNRLLTVGAKIAGAVGVPVIIAILTWTGGTLVDLRERVGKIESRMDDTFPTIYPRGEASQAINAANARMDGMEQIQSDTLHRVGALEAASNRFDRH